MQKIELTIAILATCDLKHDIAITFRTGSLADSVLQIKYNIRVKRYEKENYYINLVYDYLHVN